MRGEVGRGDVGKNEMDNDGAITGDVYCRISNDDDASPRSQLKELSVASYRNDGARWGRPAPICAPSGTISPLPGHGSTKERESRGDL